MNIFGHEINRLYARWLFINVLILIDIIAISLMMFFDLPYDVVLKIHIYDFIVCIILLVQWFWTLYLSNPKRIFLKRPGNWIDLIASIPFDAILPFVMPHIIVLRYLRLLKMIRVVVLFKRLSHNLDRFFKVSNLDTILSLLFFTIIIFTMLMWIFGNSYDMFDDFYFVITTLATVGYGDVVPATTAEKLISIVLIIVGVFIFSTITAAISSFFTDRLLSDTDNEFETLIEEKEKSMNIKFDELKSELEKTQNQNEELKREISELKELIREK